MPLNCLVEYDNSKFKFTQMTNFGKPMILSKLKAKTTTIQAVNIRPLQTENITLEEIHQSINQ